VGKGAAPQFPVFYALDDIIDDVMGATILEGVRCVCYQSILCVSVGMAEVLHLLV